MKMKVFSSTALAIMLSTVSSAVVATNEPCLRSHIKQAVETFVSQTHKQCMNHCRKHKNSLHWCSTKCSGGGGGGGGGWSHGSDPARIHQGCGPDYGTYPEYVDGNWQCTDGVWGPFDNAAIHSECNVGVHYSSETSSWYCKDDGPNGLNSVDWQFYVQRGCQNGAGWSSDSNNAHGEGWYCNDDVDVSDYDDSFYENGFVRVGCPGDIHFDDNLGAWYCNS